MREHYDLEDRSGTKLGEAERNLSPMYPAKFVVTGASGLEAMHISARPASLRNQFTFYDAAGAELGTIRRKLAKFFGEEFWIEKNGVEFMRIYGNSSRHDYQMQIRGIQVASVHEKRVSNPYQMFGFLQDFMSTILEISIMGDADHRVVIGAVIVIEHLKTEGRTVSPGD